MKTILVLLTVALVGLVTGIIIGIKIEKENYETD